MNRRRFITASGAIGAGFTLTAALPTEVLGANDRLRVGVIGCGGRGTYLINQVLSLAPAMNLEIAAVCDVWRLSRERAVAAVAKRQGGAPQAFTRYADLLALKDLDAVMIATPDFAHTPILLDATRLKKDAFVEKPLATTLDHAKAAVTQVREHRTIVQIGSQRRSDARHQAGAKLIQSGILGKISEVEAAWHDAAPRWARPYADVRAEDIDWDQYLMYLPKEVFDPVRFRRWHFFKDFTVGTPSLLGSHLIDVATWFMDDPLPSSVVAHGGVYVWKDGREHADTLDCILEYPKGFIVNYSTRLGNNKPLPEVVFYGTKGTFDTETWTARGEGGGPDRLKEPLVIERPAAHTSNEPAAGAALAATENDPRIEGSGHVRNWIECVRSRQTPNAPIEVGYSHSVAGIMCFKAWETGRRQAYDAAKVEITAA